MNCLSVLDHFVGLSQKRFNICVRVCVCVCVCALFTPFIISLKKMVKRVLSALKQQIDQADFRDWISFLPYNVIDEISLNAEPLSANTYSL